MVEASHVEGKKVVEIGPGLGFLTQLLAQKAEHVIAIEKDTRFKPVLDELVERYSNLEIYYNDALEVALPQYLVVSNLPYSISSPITFKILKNGTPATLCYQKEFGERLLAQPGTREYGRLSMSCSFLADVEKVCHVPKNSFWPQPEIDSIIVKLKPKKAPEDWKQIEKLIRVLFTQPKKKIDGIAKKIGIKLPDNAMGLRIRQLEPELIKEIYRLNQDKIVRMQ